MRFEKRKNINGSSYFSFVWYDSKTSKQTRLSRQQIRNRFGKDVLTEEDAKHCLKLLSAIFETEKIRIEKRLSWEKEFYNFSKLLEQYALECVLKLETNTQQARKHFKSLLIPSISLAKGALLRLFHFLSFSFLSSNNTSSKVSATRFILKYQQTISRQINKAKIATTNPIKPITKYEKISCSTLFKTTPSQILTNN